MKKLFTISIEDESKEDHFVKGFMEGKNYMPLVDNPKFDIKKKEGANNKRGLPNPMSELDFMKEWVKKILINEVNNGHAGIKARASAKTNSKINLL